MRSLRWILFAAALAVTGRGFAQPDGPNSVVQPTPAPRAAPLVQKTPVAPVPAPAPKALVPGLPAASAVVQTRPGMFAAASAANVKRLTPEQRDEWRFLKEAAAASRFESEASRVALAKSNAAGVRTFATNLINHHASAGVTLQQMLQMRSMAAPMLSNEQRKVLNRLGKIHGTKFDREYLDEVALRSGQESIASFERASASVRDPALKAWIDRMLPTMRYQLSMADRAATGNTRVVKAQPVVLPHMATRVMGHGAPPPSTSQLGEARAVNMQLGPAGSR